MNSHFSIKLASVQTEIDAKMDMVKLWKLDDRNDPLFQEIEKLIQDKQDLVASFEPFNSQVNHKRCQTDAMLGEAFGSHVARRGRMNSRDHTGDDTNMNTAMTRATSAPPTSFVEDPRRSQQTKETAWQSPDNDVPRSQQTNEATVQSSDNDDEEYADCTYDSRDYVDPASILRRPPNESKNLGSVVVC